MTKSSRNLTLGLCFTLLALFSTSCASNEALYSWDNYENASYAYTKDPSEKNFAKLDKCFDKMFDKQEKSYRKVVPPGLCAEKAYMLLKEGKKDEAMRYFDLEIKNYPESKLFIDRIKKQIEQ